MTKLIDCCLLAQMWLKVLRGAAMIAAAVIALALLLVAAVHLPPVRARVLAWATARASQQLGFIVEADALDYNVLGVSIALQHARVAAHGEPAFLQADTLGVVLARRLWLGTVEVERIVIIRPSLTLVRHADGRTNLPTVESSSSQQSSPLHLGLVTVNQLTVEAVDEGAGHRASLGPIDVQVDTRAGNPNHRFGPCPINVTIGNLGGPGVDRALAGTFAGRLGFDGQRLTVRDLRLDTAEGHLSATGWVDLIADTIRFGSQGRVDADLARIGQLLGDTGKSLRGSGTASFSVGGPAADPTARAIVDVLNLGYQSMPEANVNAEATYASGLLTLERLNVTSNLGNATGSGTLRLAGSAPTESRLRGHLENIDVDRVLDSAGARGPIRIGSRVDGDIEVALQNESVLAPEWWRRTTSTGSLQLTPRDSGLAVEGRVRLGVQGDRWEARHELTSAPARAAIEGLLSGEFGRTARGELASNLLGRSRVRLESLQALTPFLEQAGVAVPDQIRNIDGSIEATVDPRGTFAAPRAAAVVGGRDIRLSDFSDGRLDATVIVDGKALTARSLQARFGTTAATLSGQYSWSGQFDARFDASADDVNALMQLAGAGDVPVTGAASLAGTLQGSLESPRGAATLTARDLAAYDVAVGTLDADLRVASQRLEIDARAPALNARLQGSVGIREPYSFHADATLDGSSIAALLPPSVRDQIAVEGVVSTSVRSNGTLRELSNAAAEVSLGALNGRISNIPVVLEAPATISIAPNALTATRVGLRVGDQTTVQLEGTLGLNEATRGFDVTATGPLSDVLLMAAPALPDVRIEAEQSNVAMNLHVGGTLLAPVPSGTLTAAANAIRYADQPPLTHVSVAARFEPAEITVQSIAANWLDATLQGQATVPLRLIVPEPSARPGASGVAAWGSRWFAGLPAEPRRAMLNARITGVSTRTLEPFVDPSTLASVSGNIDASLTADADALSLPRVRGALVLDNASLVLAEVPFMQSAPTRIRLEDGRASIEEFRWNAEGNELRVTGSADVLSVDRVLDLAVDGDVDLRILGAFVSGVASGGTAHSALTIKGPAAAPEVVGSIGVSGGELRIDSPSLAASDLAGTINIPADRNATISLKGSLNGGTVDVQGAVALANVMSPSGRVALTARNVTLDYPEGFQTESNADLVLAFSPSAANIPDAALSGRIDVLNGLYREPIVVSRTLLSGFGAQTGMTTEGEASFLSHFTLDVAVATAEQIRVDNNYGRVNFTANLQVTGTAAQPGALGRIQAEPDGEIYLAGNTYHVESLVVDLSNPRAIAPDVSFLANTRVSNVPIELSLQCSATGACEREVRSQASGVTSAEAEAMLFGISADTAEAGAQLARLLSAELLGIVGQTFRVDTLRLEQGSGRADLFDDPTLIAGYVNPASRLTIGKRLGEHVELAYSQNLAENGFTMSTQYFGPAGMSARALLFDDQSREYEFRHEPRFGAGQPQRPPSTGRTVVAGVRWTGTPGFAERALHDQLHLTEGDRFAFAAWQADRERLLAFYQARGFFEVRLRTRRLLPSGEPIDSAPGQTIDRIVLEYAIERGRPTSIDITGYDLPGRVRDRIVKRWSSAIFDGFLERDAATIVREYLFEEKRLRATVSAKLLRSDDSKTLHIAIDPGPSLTPRLVFEGNAAIPTEALIAVAQTAGPLAAWLEPAAFRLVMQRRYHDDGFLSAEVRVEPPLVEGDDSVVRVVIDEGDPWLVGRVTVEREFAGGALQGVPSADDRLGLAIDSRYMQKAVAEGVAKLEQQFRDAGYLAARVTAETTRDPSIHRANIHVVATPGVRTVLESVQVEGTPSKRAAVERRATIVAGAPVSASELSATRRRLYETGAYRSIDIDLQDVGAQPNGAPPNVGDTLQGVPVPVPTDRRVIARIRVEERPRYTFRYGLAVNDEVVAPDQRSQSIGFAADLENQNVLGLGATLGLSARLRRDQSVGRGYLTAPRFFTLPLRSTVYLSTTREDIGSGDTAILSDVTEISGEQSYLLRRSINLRYGYDLGRNRTTITRLNEDAAVITVRVARLNTSGLIDRRDDPFDPSRGWFSSANFELSRPGIGSELSFLKNYVQQYQFVPMRHGITFASAARVGLARTYRDETLIPSERFFAGGATSVRGYKNEDLGPRSIFGDAAGGSALLILNGELRFPIYKSLRGVGFVDVGNVYPTVGDLFHTGVQAGTGGGVRLNTPVGLLRLDLGTAVNPRPFDPSWTVTFGLGQAF